MTSRTRLRVASASESGRFSADDAVPTDGKPHVHCVVSGEGNSAIGGHLHRAVVGPWFVNAYVVPFDAGE
jgi:predicted DNA-binding protein with PD1-like motif